MSVTTMNLTEHLCHTQIQTKSPAYYTNLQRS